MSGLAGDATADVQMTSSLGNFPVWERGFWMRDKLSGVGLGSGKSLAPLCLWYCEDAPGIWRILLREKSQKLVNNEADAAGAFLCN